MVQDLLKDKIDQAFPTDSGGESLWDGSGCQKKQDPVL